MHGRPLMQSCRTQVAGQQESKNKTVECAIWVDGKVWEKKKERKAKDTKEESECLA